MSLVLIEDGVIRASVIAPMHGDSLHEETGRVSNYWHAMYKKHVDVTGTFTINFDPSQTDRDRDLLAGFGNTGYATFVTSANGNEVHFGNLNLNPGTYKVTVVTTKSGSKGIIEILHGTTSIGTFDCYTAGAPEYNVPVTFIYSPTTYVTGNIRLKNSGKNASSINYWVEVSRFEIVRLMDVNSVFNEFYANHTGATDNASSTVIAGGGSATTQAATHKMDLDSGNGAGSYASFGSKVLFTLNTTDYVIANFIVQTIANGTGANKTTICGLLESMVLPISFAAFGCTALDQWQTVTQDASGSQINNIAALSNGDNLTIIARSDYVMFFKNGVLLATHAARIPTVALQAGATVICGSAAGTSRTLGIDLLMHERKRMV